MTSVAIPAGAASLKTFVCLFVWPGGSNEDPPGFFCQTAYAEIPKRVILIYMDETQSEKLKRAAGRIAAGRYVVFFRPDRSCAPVPEMFKTAVMPSSGMPGVYMFDTGGGVVPETAGAEIRFRVGKINFRCTAFERWDGVYDMAVDVGRSYLPVLFAPEAERVKEKYLVYLEKVLKWDAPRLKMARAWLDVQLACAGFAAKLS